jgi:hypothetical protein
MCNMYFTACVVPDIAAPTTCVTCAAIDFPCTHFYFYGEKKERASDETPLDLPTLTDDALLSAMQKIVRAQLAMAGSVEGSDSTQPNSTTTAERVRKFAIRKASNLEFDASTLFFKVAK